MAEYIERESLIEVLRKSHSYHARTSRDYSLLGRDIRLVKEQPAADVVEVVHGRWILEETCGKHTAKFHCSVCDKIPKSLCIENYCPNCGAKMDGDRNETQ